jgi:hypothetical protein
MIVTIFQELNKVIVASNASEDLNSLELSSNEAQTFLGHLKRNESMQQSFDLTYSDSPILQSFFLGNNVAKENDKSIGTVLEVDTKKLIITILKVEDVREKLKRQFNDSVLLITDFSAFSFYKVRDTSITKLPFTSYTQSELTSEIEITGSVWDSFFPKHHGIVTRTISYSIPKQHSGNSIFEFKNSLFKKQPSHDETTFDLLKCLETESCKLTDLHTFDAELNPNSRSQKAKSKKREGRFIMNKYYPNRSRIFDFGTPPESFIREDYVTTYLDKKDEFHRDFIIVPNEWGKFKDELKEAAFDVLHTIAIRRTSLFRHDFTSRLFNILLPPVLLNNPTDMSEFLTVFPCILLNKIPNKKYFRNTISITYIVCSAKETKGELVSDKQPLEKLYLIKDELMESYYSFKKTDNKFISSGPLKYYLHIPENTTISETVRHINEGILKKLLHLNKKTNDKVFHDSVHNILYSQTRIANLASVFLLVDWKAPKGFTQPWEKWIAKEDSIFDKILFKTISHSDFMKPSYGNTSLFAMKMRELNIGNTLGSDMTGMTLINPREDMKIIIFPKHLEKYPNFSLIRWMAWHYYIDTALSSLRVLIDKFHTVLAHRTDLNFIIATLNEMVDEFVELYDLDLVNLFYRKEYEKIRNLLGIDNDYTQLMTQFNSAKEDSSLREQRLVNKLLVGLTLATATISIVSTIAANDKWNSMRYLSLTLILSFVIVWVGYLLFDPLRKVLESLITKIKNSLK